MSHARHGADPSRFGRLFPADGPRGLPPCVQPEATLEQLAQAMGTDGPPGTIPSGFTYLGQFIAHDLSFDASAPTGVATDPTQVANLRSPQLDLDSLYGGGPKKQPELYESTGPGAGARLRQVGTQPPARGTPDLPRNADGTAILADSRNDENVITAQVTLLFLRFHNDVVDGLLEREPGKGAAAIFAAARRTVRRRYGLIVREWLARVCGAAPAPSRSWPFAWTDGPFAPVELTAAAFRFGHSMVREQYALNGHAAVAPFRTPTATGLAGRTLSPDAVLEWWRLFDVPGAKPPTMLSQRIDHHLAVVLSEVPDAKPGEPSALALRNLLRGQQLGLPSGQDVATALGLTPLAPRQVLAPDVPAAIGTSTPLWFYVLREADVLADGQHLGPVGARIVGEVILALLPKGHAKVTGTGSPIGALIAETTQGKPTLAV